MPMLEEEARKRQTEALKQGSRYGNFSTTGKGLASQHAAKLFNVNERYAHYVP